MNLPVSIDHERIAEFCRLHHIVWLALFGSILREDFNPESDIDVLIRFDPEYVPRLFALVQMENELSETLGWRVDLRTPEDPSRYFRERVLAKAVVQYAF
jgi:predicted nucleotidyltransferase